MRLDKVRSFQNVSSYSQSASNRQSSNIFAGTLQAAVQSRIVTEKKDGYIRKYRVYGDGSRELLSEEIDVSYDSAHAKPNEALNLLQQLNFKR